MIKNILRKIIVLTQWLGLVTALLIIGMVVLIFLGRQTIGQLDEEALFYMQQRGIGIKEARALLMYAFANTVLESVKIPEVKDRITRLIANKLNVNIGFNI